MKRPASDDLVKEAWQRVRDPSKEPLPPAVVLEPARDKRPAGAPQPLTPPVTVSPRPTPTTPRDRPSTRRPPQNQVPDAARTIVRLVRLGLVVFIVMAIVGGFLGGVTRDSDFEEVVVTTERSGLVDTDIVFDSDQRGGIAVVADGVTVDCNGFSITGNGEGSGILITERTGVRVLNCRVLNFEAGIHMVGGSGNTIDSTTVTGSSVGIVLASTNDNTISNSAFNANGSGIVVTSGSSGNTIIGNEASGNGSDGFISFADAGPDNVFQSNTAERNRGFGFVDSSAHSTEGRYEANSCDSNNRVSSPAGLCSLAG